MNRRSVLGALIVVALSVPAAASAQPGGWVFLGQRPVNFRADRDVIPVTAAQGAFGRIQLRVQGNGVEILSLRVNYANGNTQNVALRQWIPAGGQTRAIDLPGAVRVIRSVEMVYRTRGARAGRATVQLFGSHAPGAAPVVVVPTPPVQVVVTTPAPPAPVAVVPAPMAPPVQSLAPLPVPAGWVFLGERIVSFHTERDVIPVTAAAGRFRRLQLEVHQTGIFLVQAVVTFGNGETWVMNINRAIQAGSRTRAVDLPGGPRLIRTVQLVYRSLPRVTGNARVRLIGVR